MSKYLEEAIEIVRERDPLTGKEVVIQHEINLHIPLRGEFAEDTDIDWIDNFVKKTMDEAKLNYSEEGSGSGFGGRDISLSFQTSDDAERACWVFKKAAKREHLTIDCRTMRFYPERLKAILQR